ncbi:PREDICTED: ubiquitin carboxyl-terminal hydrolase MINDY-2-like isoform X2 [Lupinus angustifolius]|uniref:ubiquitin carboxyl-terminal hydrolase MINDY-2-like isoform X2 n=1 Tax=Lupinus angustifolius TaxID=3871 RepID=UPI00092EDE2C|nr:PREDICTED: ubiquitin carboxyl-terminal hydrolase MINDY-2-like isoform X2 [Lupinus angustifolius]
MAESSCSSISPNTNHEEHEEEEALKELIHKTKSIQFLGRNTPIILQNDNGPCPLLAICNALLLRNNLNLNPDIAEVSQEKLLSLVAERLIDSNTNVNNKDAGYVENQQQNIADAIDLLPRLATGIDVNIKFRRIGDFEFTRECAIFDLLDIPLCHGWIVDPQDYDTANALGSKSYNALMVELVSLETLNMEVQHKNDLEEDCVDFVAATTAVLGVPSPSLSKTRSFDDSLDSVSDEIPRKGDLEEEEKLLRALKLSENDSKVSVSDAIVGHADGGAMSVSIDEGMHNKQVIPVDSGDKLEKSTGAGINGFREATEPSISEDCPDSVKNMDDQISSASILGEATSSTLKTNAINDQQSPNMGPEESIDQNDVTENVGLDSSVQNESAAILSPEEHSVSLSESCADVSGRGGKIHDQPTLTTSDCAVVDDSQRSISNTNSDSSGVRFHQTDVSGALPSTVDDGEPIYEGEECVLDTRTQNVEDHEPVYEGEVVLAEQAEKGTLAASDLRPKDEITPQQDGLKEREICVFFRNNHFSTMFKFEGELYLLATDQGYINQPDLVWEKLNEVNGDTLFMTSNFKEFKVEENHESSTWNENNVMTSTADYLASIDSASQADLDINSDLQLAIALQQQEFEQQPPPPRNPQQSSISGSSRLVTGPQVARNTGRHSSSSSSPKTDGKSKEKCTVM